MLSLPEVGAKLKASLSTVRRLVASGDLPSVKLGKGRTALRRVKASDLAAFVRARRTGSD